MSTTLEDAQALFASPDADLLIRCEPDTDEYTFKVHKHRLASASAFFEDMVQSAKPQDGTTAELDCALPEITMEEEWRVVYFLLGSADNKLEVLEDLRGFPYPWLLKVYSAANKYGFANMKVLTSSLLCSDEPSVPEGSCAVDIYMQAVLFDDREKTAKYLDKAAAVPLQSLSITTLHQLPTGALQKLLQSQGSRVSKVLHELSGPVSTAVRRRELPESVPALFGQLQELFPRK